MSYIIAKKEQSIFKIRLSDILYVGAVTSRPHLLTVRTVDGFYEFYGNLKNLEEIFGLTLFRCHRKYLVNLKQVRGIDKKQSQILFFDTEVKSIEYARRRLKDFEYAWKNS